MFKIILKIFFVISLFIISSCSKDKGDTTKEVVKDTPQESVKEDKKRLLIGISLPTQKDERWVRDKNIFEKYAKELGVDVIVMSADNDMNLQVSQVNELLSKKINALLIAPVDSKLSSSLVEKAHDVGLPVIAYGRPVMNTNNLNAFCSVDNFAFGRAQAKFLVENVPSGNYLVLSGAPTDNNAKELYNGSMEVLTPLIDKGKIKVISDSPVENWDPKNAAAIADSVFRNNIPSAILAPNDGTAGGIIEVMEKYRLTGKVPITGQDAEFSALKRIKEGSQSMSVFADTVKQAESALDTALVLAQGNKVDTVHEFFNGAIKVPAVLQPPMIVTRENLRQTVDMLYDYGVLTEEQYKELN